MFGILRYILATLVVFGHLWPFLGGRINWSGHYAILTFFSLSGYLMTLILHERYRFSASGLRRYAANRALRIFPPYWAAAALSACLIAVYPAAASALAAELGVPQSALEWFQTFVIVGLHVPRDAWLIPPAWSLSVELIFYALMPIVLSRWRAGVIAWVLASIAYIGVTVLSGISPISADWVPSKSFSLAFSLGALVYFLRGVRLPIWVAGGAGLGYALNLALGPSLWGDRATAGVYVCIACSFVVIWYLSQTSARNAPKPVARADRVLGDLAYPIFLVHFQAAVLMVQFFFGGTKPAGAVMFLASLPLVHLLAIAVHVGVEVPVSSLRDRVRPAP